MNSLSKAARRRRATEEAAEWLVRIESGPLTAADRVEFADWLRESPLHVAETLRVANLDTLLREYSGWRQLGASGSFTSAEVISLATKGRAETLRSIRRVPWFMRLGTVAAVCVTLLLAGVLCIESRSSEMVLHTQRGERRELTLADGSKVAAEPETELRIKLSSTVRAISLLHGSAVFHVAKDRTRPFVVGASGTQVTAVGTIFRVADVADKVVIVVSEGKVSVKPTDRRNQLQARSGLPPIALAAHQQLTITSAGLVSPIQVVNVPVDTNQQDEQMVFDSETVASIITRFNGTNILQIRVSDPSLASVPVSGVFNASDPMSFVAFLEATGRARAVRASPNEIVLEQAGR
jgi:transmembrane sensor